MFELKTLSKEAIPNSLERVERYRLLGEPAVAESICHDILQVEPEHQQALVQLILVTTDQFAHDLSIGINKVLEIIPRLGSEYERAYYTGITYERQAKARLARHYPGAGFDAYDLFLEAMSWFEKAEGMRPVNQDTVLRWNNCARLIQANNLSLRPKEGIEPGSE